MKKKDKEKVLDEVWTEERVRSFLELTAPVGVDPDYHILYNAYKNMRIENFEQFLELYQQTGKSFAVSDQNGISLLALIQQHKKSSAYAEALAKYL